MPARTSFAIPVGATPVSGPIGIPVDLDFSTVDTSNGDFMLEESAGVIGFVQSVWIDNSGNAQPLSLRFHGTNQILIVKAHTQGYYPIVPFNGTFRWSGTSAGAATIVKVIFMNVPFGAAQWLTQ